MTATSHLWNLTWIMHLKVRSFSYVYYQNGKYTKLKGNRLLRFRFFTTLTLLHFQILVPPRTFVNNSFGQDGYFPFRPWLRPSSYNQCFYRSYRHYQKSIPFLFPPRCKNKLSITTNQTVLIPRAHLSPKT